MTGEYWLRCLHALGLPSPSLETAVATFTLKVLEPYTGCQGLRYMLQALSCLVSCPLQSLPVLQANLAAAVSYKGKVEDHTDLAGVIHHLNIATT